MTAPPGQEIRAEIETEVLHRVRGADPRRPAVSMRDGVVSVSGRVESRSVVACLVTAVLAVEGMVGSTSGSASTSMTATLLSRSSFDPASRGT